MYWYCRFKILVTIFFFLSGVILYGVSSFNSQIDKVRGEHSLPFDIGSFDQQG